MSSSSCSRARDELKADFRKRIDFASSSTFLLVIFVLTVSHFARVKSSQVPLSRFRSRIRTTPFSRSLFFIGRETDSLGSNPQLSSIHLSSRISRFLVHYLTHYLPLTPFDSCYPAPTPSFPSPSIPFDIISTPDTSSTSSSRFERTRVHETNNFWIRVPALEPRPMYPVLLRKQRITMPALPALFDCFEMTTTIDFVDVDGEQPLPILSGVSGEYS